jgi:hypothetical protein
MCDSGAREFLPELPPLKCAQQAAQDICLASPIHAKSDRRFRPSAGKRRNSAERPRRPARRSENAIRRQYQQHRQGLRIKATQRESDGERGRRVPRGKPKRVTRYDVRPAMRLYIAGTRPAENPFHPSEPCERGDRTSCHRCKPMAVTNR